MAEFVQQSMEQMLPEIQQIRRIGLMSKEETDILIRRRKQYEYKLRRRTREKRDYIKYIKYEMNVLDLIKKRRKKIGYNHKLMEIDIQVVKRIHKLFRLAEGRFQDDVKLWLSHIDFAKKRKEKAVTARTYARALQTHSRNSSLWIGAAKYQFYTIENMDMGRTLFQKGLHINPESEDLWFEYFKSEMFFTDKMMDRAEKLEKFNRAKQSYSNDAILNAKLPILVYNKMAEELPNSVMLLFKVASYCSTYNWGNRVESHILEDIKERFPNDPLIFSLLAENCPSLNESIDCLRTGLKESKDKKKMCSIYADFCLKRATKENALELMNGVFEYVMHCDEETVCKCVICIQKMCGEEKALEFTNIALKSIENSAALWSSKIMLSPKQNTINLIKEATNMIHLKEIWPVFETALDFVTDIQQNDEIVSFVMEVICLSNNNSDLKVKLFEWVVKNSKDIKENYEKILKYFPRPSEIYAKMIEELVDSDTFKRKVAQDWIREHPRTIDSWYWAMDVFKFNPIEKGEIYQRALVNLSPYDCQELRQKLATKSSFSTL